VKSVCHVAAVAGAFAGADCSRVVALWGAFIAFGLQSFGASENAALRAFLARCLRFCCGRSCQKSDNLPLAPQLARQHL
jgi:hypothetical protein